MEEVEFEEIFSGGIILSNLQSEQLRLQRLKAGGQVSNRSAPKANGHRRESTSTTLSEDPSDSDDNSSVLSFAISGPARTSCGACKKKESKLWWKAPRGFELSSAMLCDSCSMSWRKYAELKISRSEDVAKAKYIDKRDGTPLSLPTTKRPKVSC